jgi:hypothetical protein
MTDFAKACHAVSSMILAYNGHIAYPTVIDEMKNPHNFPKSLAMVGISTTTFYCLIAALIYTFSGQDVASPVLGSAAPLVSKVAWGIATPTVVVAGVIAALVCAKQIYKQFWARKEHERVTEEKSFRSYGSWILILVILYVISFIIAGVIPNFGNLLALIGALFGTWFALGLPSIFWLKMWSSRRLRSKNWEKIGLVWLNVLIVLISAAVVSLLRQARVGSLQLTSDRSAVLEFTAPLLAWRRKARQARHFLALIMRTAPRNWVLPPSMSAIPHVMGERPVPIPASSALLERSVKDPGNHNENLEHNLAVATLGVSMVFFVDTSRPVLIIPFRQFINESCYCRIP